jgi:hypothetical protein
LDTIASQFQRLLDSIKDAVDHENWLAGLALTLMLPDICGAVETPGEPVGKRYARWWDTNFGASYKYGTGSNDHVKGEEVYQLRCAYLHEGRDLQADKKEISATIEKFKFATSEHHLVKKKTSVLLNEKTSVLLNVQTFCLDMRSRVEEWEKNKVSKDPSMQTRAEELLKIYVFAEVDATVSITGVVTPRYLRSCKKCGKLFPQEEHESLCSDCR